jgi:hypothetical protein
MLFMVIERFKNQDPIPVHRRVRDPGITFPDGPTYVEAGSNPTSIAGSSLWNTTICGCCSRGC